MEKCGIFRNGLMWKRKMGGLCEEIKKQNQKNPDGKESADEKI
jgi:hypothetical protein